MCVKLAYLLQADICWRQIFVGGRYLLQADIC